MNYYQQDRRGYVQCMGGWCSQREKCAHYHQPQETGLKPAERLCGKVEELVLEKPSYGPTAWLSTA